jgi:hypothetical protein
LQRRADQRQRAPEGLSCANNGLLAVHNDQRSTGV